MRKIRVDNGKYTFLSGVDGYKFDVLRHDEPWVRDITASNAITSMMAELDAARVVLKAVRIMVADNETDGTEPDIDDLKAALRRHAALVSDNEQPSEWTK